MNDMSGTGLPGTLQTGLSTSVVANEVSERLGLTETRSVSQMVDMTKMTPSDALSSTGFALADQAEGQYIVYDPNGGSFTVDLSKSSGTTLQTQWLNVATGTASAAGTVTGGSASQGFTPPIQRRRGVNPHRLLSHHNRERQHCEQ